MLQKFQLLPSLHMKKKVWLYAVGGPELPSNKTSKEETEEAWTLRKTAEGQRLTNFMATLQVCEC